VPRTNADSWDLTTGVGATATMVAAARAVASRQADPVLDDPFAAVLVRKIGINLFTRIVDGLLDFSEIGAGWFPSLFGIRGRSVDDFVADACRRGIRQVVILASGLDCRAYRLAWPPATTTYEVDQPAVIGWKTNALAELCHPPTVQHRCVGIDLRQDWPLALRQKGFDPERPTAWIAEGLLIGYLPPSAHDKILDDITALSAPGSRIVADHFDVRRPDSVSETLNELHDMWSKREPALNLRSVTFPGPRRDPAVYLAERGWTTHDTELIDLFDAAGRPAPTEVPAATSFWRFFSGTRTSRPEENT
jgi:methyltransferase (TIGR00027 family)